MVTHCLCIACLGRGYGPGGLESPCALCHGERRLTGIDPDAAIVVTRWARGHGLSHADDESRQIVTFPEGATYKQMEAVRRGERFVPGEGPRHTPSIEDRLVSAGLAIADIEMRLSKLERG